MQITVSLLIGVILVVHYGSCKSEPLRLLTVDEAVEVNLSDCSHHTSGVPKEEMGMDGQYSQAVGQAPRLLGNYRILNLLGQGGFADVYLGEHVHLRTKAAIKVLQVRLVESNIQSFLNEARTIAHLVHPYIIRVLDFGVEVNTPFLVMDYAPKGTLRQRFLQGIPLPANSLFPYIKQAAAALQYAHDKKLIHRDVKPENMLLGPNEEILLSDFGFALMQSSVSRSSPEAVGTASYMAPEQLQGRPQPASDQYSLGVVAYEWLAGSCPFQGTFFELASQHMLAVPPSLRKRIPGLSVEVEHVVMRALAKEPERRFPNVRDFSLALEQACLASRGNSSSHVPLAPSTSSGNSTRELPRTPEKSISRLQNGFPATSTSSNFSRGQAAPSSSQVFRQNRVQPDSSLFTSSPQKLSDSTQPSQSNRQSFLSTFTNSNQTIRLDSLNKESRASAIPNTPPTEGTSQNDSSSFPSAKATFPAPFYRSQSQITSLSPEQLSPLNPVSRSSQTFPSQGMQASRNSQTFPPQGNKSASISSQSLTPAILDGLPALDLDAISEPRFTVFNEEQSPFSNPAMNSTSSSRTLNVPFSRDISKQYSSRVMTIFIIAMVVLIIGTTSILVELTNSRRNSAVTPNEQQRVTNGQATITPKSTSITTVSSGPVEQNPYGNHNGVLVLNSPLNQQDQRMQWSNSAGCTFTAGSYHVIANPQTQGFTLCNAAASDYTNFVYQVQMTFTKTTLALSSGGLVFRGNGGRHQFYFFEVFSNGSYAFYRCPGTNGGACPVLSSSTVAGTGLIAAFDAGNNHPNTIAIEANNSVFTVYVNNQLVVGPITDTMTDPNYSHGMIGMMSRQGNANTTTDVAFSNAKLWKF